MKFEDTIIGRPNTVRTTLGLYRKWVEPNIDSDLETNVTKWLTAGLAPKTVKQLISIYARYVEFTGGSRPLTRSLCAKVSRLEQEEPPKALTRKQAEVAIRKWNELYPLDGALPLMGLHAGLRIGEVMGLRWKDIDFVKSEVHVHRSYDGPTKNGKSRKIPMSKVLEQTLQRTDNYLGADQESKVFHPCDVNRRLDRVCRESGLERFSFHAFRHTFATWALETGTSLKAVSEALGHAQVSTTLNTYYHLLQERMDMGFLDD